MSYSQVNYDLDFPEMDGDLADGRYHPSGGRHHAPLEELFAESI
jgi:hypothetical protein